MFRILSVVVVLPASTWANIPIFLYRLRSVMVLSLTLDERGGVKTARSYPLLALESSFSARFSVYRITGRSPMPSRTTANKHQTRRIRWLKAAHSQKTRLGVVADRNQFRLSPGLFQTRGSNQARRLPKQASGLITTTLNRLAPTTRRNARASRALANERPKPLVLALRFGSFR